MKATAADKPTRLQEHKLMSIAKAGGFGVVVNPENFEATFEMLAFLAGGGSLSHVCKRCLERYEAIK